MFIFLNGEMSISALNLVASGKHAHPMLNNATTSVPTHRSTYVAVDYSTVPNPDTFVAFLLVLLYVKYT